MNITERQANLILDKKAILGEAPLWDPYEEKLLWVDIEGKKLHQFDPVNGVDTEYELNARPGTVAVMRKSTILIAMQDGIHQMDLLTGRMKLLADPEKHIPENRFNDGKAGPCGRFYIGSMHVQAKPGSGSFYMIDLDGKIKKIFEMMDIPNGMCWTGDERIFYLTDSNKGIIWAHDYDKKTGELSNRRDVIKIPEHMGIPDGMTIDTDDKLWVAHYGAGFIGRWDPISGELLEKIDVPVPKCTCCAFGDKDYRTLYITTARNGLSSNELKRYPESGGLFSVRTEVKGREAYIFS